MRNAVIDKLFLRIFAQPKRLPFENIHDVYDHSSEGSALRDLVISIILNIGTNGLVEIYSDEVPRKFLVDLLKIAESDGIAPFSHKQQWEMGPWLESKKRRICREYHQHDEEDLGGDEDMDEEYYDDGGEDGGPREWSERTRRELGSIYAIRARYSRY
jgi:hypothetical protein